MRIDKEIVNVLSNRNFTITSTNRGAILRSIIVGEEPITRPLGSAETLPGEKGALFCAPVIFGRVPGRSVFFNSRQYLMPYPDDILPDEIDPDKLYIHGIHHYYTYDIESCSSSRISYILPASRLPASYPFPHTTRITYALDNDDLIISVEVLDTSVPCPAMLTVHPFFLYKLPSGETIQFKGKLIKRFDYDNSEALPQPKSPPNQLEGDGPYSDWTCLDTSLDHSFISKDGISEIRWHGGPHIIMKDESVLDTPQPHYPLQIWTSGGISRNACGIEPGGPANLFELVHHGHVPKYYLAVVEPGESKKRVVRMKKP